MSSTKLANGPRIRRAPRLLDRCSSRSQLLGGYPQTPQKRPRTAVDPVMTAANSEKGNPPVDIRTAVMVSILAALCVVVPIGLKAAAAHQPAATDEAPPRMAITIEDVD